MAFFVPVNSLQQMGDSHNFQKARLAVLRLSGFQLLTTLLLTVLAMWAFDLPVALSVMVGGLIGLLAGFYQAQRMLRVDASGHPEAFMRGLWVSELVKIFMTVALFILAIRVLRVQMVPTIVGYASTYIVYWAALGTSYPWFETGADNNDRDRNWPA